MEQRKRQQEDREMGAGRGSEQDKGEMTTREAGQMGGQKVKRLVEEGKEMEDEE